MQTPFQMGSDASLRSCAGQEPRPAAQTGATRVGHPQLPHQKSCRMKVAGVGRRLRRPMGDRASTQRSTVSAKLSVAYHPQRAIALSYQDAFAAAGKLGPQIPRDVRRRSISIHAFFIKKNDPPGIVPNGPCRSSYLAIAAISDCRRPSYPPGASGVRWHCRWPQRHHSLARIRRQARSHNWCHNRIRS